MLLFGGTLAGAKNNGSAQPTDNGPTRPHARVLAAEQRLAMESGTEAQVITPHTDALHRLTNHELRLLEELERTRSKLQAEWRLKLKELQRDEPEAAEALFQHGPPNVEQLTQLFLVPRTPFHDSGEREGQSGPKTPVRRNQKNSFLPHKKPRQQTHAPNHESVLPRIRSTLDVLPILTTSGETPFEVGLDEHGSTPGKTTHVLPIFRLPVVNVQEAASSKTHQEIKRVEDDNDRLQASATLGLSVDEIAMLEAELNGSKFHPTQAQARKETTQAGPVHISKGRKRDGGKRQKRVMRSSRCKQHVVQDSGNSLRKELESALYNVQHLTRLVKEDIFSAQKICPVSELRTSLYFKRWGREKVENIFRRLLYNFQGIAFERWKQVVNFEKQQEKLQAYLMYKGSKKLDVFLLNWTHRKLRQAWSKWWTDIVHIKALERAAEELEAIRVIQRAFRGYRGRRFAYLIKMQKRYALESTAAIKIQRMYRGSVARTFLRIKRLDKCRQNSAIRIQSIIRGYLARRRVRGIQIEMKQHRAASKIQALYRGRKARRFVAQKRRQEKLTTAAIVIQRRYRGRLGRAKYIRRQIERHRHLAATKIQKIARVLLARRILCNLRKERDHRFMVESAAALKIQKLYRGHRSRLGTQLKLLALREKNKLRNKTAVKLQKMVRCRQARQTVGRLRQERLTSMIAQARVWVEYWGDDTNQWFYYNQQTGEALWAPPATGYTKSDGMLVLQSGKIIPDPGAGEIRDTSLAFHRGKNPFAHTDQAGTIENEQQNESDEEDRLCIECEEEDALRKCDQCEDVFCDACFEKLHSSAKREKHTWKAIGTMRCIECEKMKATRWCFVCQDPYCLGCFTIIHSKGNKTSHEWTDMSTFKKQKNKMDALQHNHYRNDEIRRNDEDAQTYDEFMRSNEYQYVTELTADEGYTLENTTPGYYTSGAQNAGGEWTPVYDENSGQYYYYNAYTGESRWA